MPILPAPRMSEGSDNPDAHLGGSSEEKNIGGEPRRRELSLAANTWANVSAKTAGILIALVLSPFIVSQVGLRIFGFWAIVSSLSQYASLLDFGIGTALTRYVAALDALEDDEGLARKVASGVVTSVLFGAILITSSCLASLFLPVGATRSWPDGWEWAIGGVGVNLACVSVASAFHALPRGLSRWDLYNASVITSQLTVGLSSVALLLGGLGLAGLGVSAALGGLALVASARVCAGRVWSGPWTVRSAQPKDVVELVRYGTNLQASTLTTVVNAQADKPMILAFGGSLKFVAYYDLASRVAFQLRALPVAVLGPLTVRAAAGTAGHGVAAIRAFYARALRIISRLGVGPLLVTYGACYPLTFAWLGAGYGSTAAILAILGAGYGTNLITGAGTAVADGCGRPDLVRNFCFVCLGTNLGLSLLLGVLIGPWGIIAATGISLAVCSLWLLRSIDRWLGLRASGVEGPLRGSAVFLAVSLAWGASTITATELLALNTRVENFLLGTVSIALYGAYCLVALPESRRLLTSMGGRITPSGA